MMKYTGNKGDVQNEHKAFMHCRPLNYIEFIKSKIKN